MEYWVGDDDPAIGLEELFGEIKSKSKIYDIYLMHGNRDFMLSKEFCQNLGIKLLPDPSVINLYGKQILIMHGDTLCIDDVAYQDFRKLVRSQSWQDEVLKKPLNERIKLAEDLRKKSLKETESKREIIMEVIEQHMIEEVATNQIIMRILILKK